MPDPQPPSATDQLQSELRAQPPAAPAPPATPAPAPSANGKAPDAATVLQTELRQPPAGQPPAATPPPPAAAAATVALGSTDAPGAVGTTPGMASQPAVVAATTVPSVAAVQSALQPAPDTNYGYFPWEPVAVDTKTGQPRWAMPSMVRNALLGLTEGPDIANYGMTSAATWDPKTGTYGVTPEASTAANLLFSEGGLRFGGVPAVRAVPAPGAPGYVPPPIPPETAANLLTPEARARIAETAPSAAPASPTGVAVTPPAPPEAVAASGAQPAGAQVTPPAQIPPRTPVQSQADLEKSVAQTAEDRAGPNLQDNNVYLPGVERTLAERDFTPLNSLDEKKAIADDPAFRQQTETLRRNNNETMVDVLGNDAGDKIALDNAYTAREAVAPPAIQLFAGEKPVDAAPIVQQIDDILAGPAGKRSAVQNTLQSVRASLFDSDGNLETMPSQLYGARQNITDLLQKGARATTDQASDVRTAKSQLEGLLHPLDDIINGGAPKYQQYLDDFRNASQPINQMEYLQQFQPSGARNIADRNGNLTLSKVQGMLSQIARDRAAPGINKAKSLTEDQIQNVIAVRNELAAVGLKDKLAAVKGSDTFQQLQREAAAGPGPLGTALRSAAGAGAEAAAHLALAGPTGGVGNALLAAGSAAYRFGIKPAVRAAQERSAAQALADAVAARKAQLLQTQSSAGTPP